MAKTTGNYDLNIGSGFDRTRIIYEQISKMHQGIADFRAKLLALLPIASGVGIFLLLNKELSPDKYPFLLGVGIFGILVTFGLCIYELNSIYHCMDLQEIARDYECFILKNCNLLLRPQIIHKIEPLIQPEQIHKIKKAVQCEGPVIGPFQATSGSAPGSRNRTILKFNIGTRRASMMVYSTVMAGWSYVAGVGLAYIIHPLHPNWDYKVHDIDLLSINISGLAAAIFVFLYSLLLWHKHLKK